MRNNRSLAIDLLALVAGAIMPLGFAPFEWRFIPVFSLALLLLLLQCGSLRRAWFRGLLFGLGMFGFGVSWVYNSLHDFGGANVVVASGIAAGLVIANALYIGLICYLFKRFCHVSQLYQTVLLFPALWVLAEWLRSWMFTGFPWLLLGYSQVDTWLGHYAPVGGVLSVSAALALLAGASALLMMGRVKEKGFGLILIALILFGGWCFSKVDWFVPIAEPIKVSLVQGNIPQEIKLQPENLSVSLTQYKRLSRDHYDSQIIIWPETAIPTFEHLVTGFTSPLLEELNESDTEILTGIFVFDPRTRRYYNSLYKIGEPDTAYHKRRLVPFGEYMPLRHVLVFLNNYIKIPMSDIARGEGIPRIKLAGFAAGLSICYESAYEHVFRSQLPGAAFLVNVSNDAWFGDSLAPHQHLEINRMRALETARYIARATNTGISAIIGPKGELIKTSSQFETAVLSGEIVPHSGNGPFVLLGHIPVLLLSMLALLIVWLECRRRPASDTVAG